MILRDSTTRGEMVQILSAASYKKTKIKLIRSIKYSKLLFLVDFYPLPFLPFRLYSNHNAQPSVFAESFFS